MSLIPRARVQLASWPTPLEHAPRLADAIGLSAGRLWLKRDDLTGLAGGGNKIRKLEWTVSAAVADGADTVVTIGAPQSNHARLTAAAAAHVGLGCVLVLAGERPSDGLVGNVLLDEILGADVVWAAERSDPDVDVVAAAEMDRLRRSGRRPALIPFGGSNGVGAHGYRLCAAEITDQLGSFDVVVCALGSGGTMAGLVAGLGADRVLGVHTGAVRDPREQVGRLLAEMGEDVGPDALRIREDQVGDGYEHLTAEARSALLLAARSGGLMLDPVYSARALAAVIAEVSEGDLAADASVVFLVSGGLPGLFGHPDVQALL